MFFFVGKKDFKIFLSNFYKHPKNFHYRKILESVLKLKNMSVLKKFNLVNIKWCLVNKFNLIKKCAI